MKKEFICFMILGILTISGLLAVVICSFYLFYDWKALGMAFARFEKLAMSSADLRSIFIAESYQNIYRINCFADGIGILSGSILTAIGLHGFYVGLIAKSSMPAAK